MSKALSVDLRDRVIAAIEGGMSCRQAAARFGVSAASAIRWRSRVRRQGDVRPGPLGGDRRSGRIEGHADLILGLVERKSDITLAELQAALAEQGVETSVSSLWRFFVRRRITLKKVGARGRTEPPRRPEPASGLVRLLARPRSRAARLHR
jgi:transposase